MNRLLFILLMLLIVLAPLPLGSNRAWAWAFLGCSLGLLAFVWAVHSLRRPGSPRSGIPAGAWLPFALVCLWISLQASPWLPSGWHHPLWGMSQEALGQDLISTITLAREDSMTALLRLLSYGLAFVLAFHLCSERRRAVAGFKWISAAGLVYAIGGLVVYWWGVDTQAWFRGLGTDLAVRGPFVNRNSFATYLGLGIVCALAMTYQTLSVRRNPAYSLPTGRQHEIEQFILRAWKPLAGLLLMISALILTHSRAGFASFVFGCLALAVAVWFRRPFTSTRSLAAVAAAFAITITAFFMTSEILMSRMDYLSLDAPGRTDAYALAMEGIQDNPILGFGYGTFADSFRLYRSDLLSAHYDKAHNTYLENIFELGWPVAMLLFFCVGRIALICLRGLGRRGRDWIFPATGLAATVLVGVHSLFDFSLQIPAVALTYACLMGAACAQSYSGRQNS